MPKTKKTAAAPEKEILFADATGTYKLVPAPEKYIPCVRCALEEREHPCPTAPKERGKRHPTLLCKGQNHFKKVS